MNKDSDINTLFSYSLFNVVCLSDHYIVLYAITNVTTRRSQKGYRVTNRDIVFGYFTRASWTRRSQSWKETGIVLIVAAFRQAVN